MSGYWNPSSQSSAHLSLVTVTFHQCVWVGFAGAVFTIGQLGAVALGEQLGLGFSLLPQPS